MITKYFSEDGCEFESAEMCKRHEDTVKLDKIQKESMNKEFNDAFDKAFKIFDDYIQKYGEFPGNMKVSSEHLLDDVLEYILG